MTLTVGQLERLKPYAHCVSLWVCMSRREGDLYQRNLCRIGSHLFAGRVWDREGSVGGLIQAFTESLGFNRRGKFTDSRVRRKLFQTSM